MRSSLRAPALLLCLLPIPLFAVTVNISVLRQPTCTYPSGQLWANASGGVGPYSYLWSTGATAPTISDLTSGNYSVTVTDFNSEEATANVDLTSANYSINSMTSPELALCVLQGSMVVDATWPGEGYFIPQLPFSVNGSSMAEFPPIWPNPDTYYAAPIYPTSGYGQWYTLPFADGTGCTGTITGYLGWPVEWPSLTVLDVEGACSGGSNGTITFQSGLEGHLQFVNVELRSANFTSIAFWGAGQTVNTRIATGLTPGDYWLRQFMSMSPFLASSGCGDSLMVTVPDLGNTCGNVSGIAFMDYNLNCTKQSNEPVVPSTVMEILPGPFYTITNSAGAYSTNLPLGSYTIEQQSTTVDDHCNSQQAPFLLTALDGLGTVMMGDTSLVPLDAMISAANGPARPGFQYRVSLNIRNLTPAGSGATSTVFTFDPTFTYVSASPNASSVVGNVVTWNQGQLTAFQQRTLHVYVQVPPDIGLLGTTLINTAQLSTTNTDANTANNSFALPVTITGAYDPNDKLASTSSQLSSELYFIDADQWIDYTLRFQNTGTDTAFNIVVTDTIGAQLDLATFIAGAASHTYAVDIRNGNTLRFAFYNIQLPDSNVNEARSHGFVSFRIRPVLPLLPGIVIENIANIYFDFNEPVITDPSVLVAEFSTDIKEEVTSNVRVFPNPNTGIFAILSNGHRLQRIELRAVDGRLIRTVPAQGEQLSMDIADLATGHYLLRLFDEVGTLTTLPIIKW